MFFSLFFFLTLALGHPLSFLSSSANIDIRPSGTTSTAKRAEQIAAAKRASAFNIRGVGRDRAYGNGGIVIKGTGTDTDADATTTTTTTITTTNTTTPKELFPDKFDKAGNMRNAGKELFADKLGGRGRRRQRAEDMFQ